MEIFLTMKEIFLEQGEMFQNSNTRLINLRGKMTKLKLVKQQCRDLPKLVVDHL